MEKLIVTPLQNDQLKQPSNFWNYYSIIVTACLMVSVYMNITGTATHDSDKANDKRKMDSLQNIIETNDRIEEVAKDTSAIISESIFITDSHDSIVDNKFTNKINHTLNLNGDSSIKLFQKNFHKKK